MTTFPSRLKGQEITRIPTMSHVVALTFDAGSNNAGLPKILSVLQRRQVTATFFLTGEWVRNYPTQAKEVASRYRVANHSYTHPHFTELSDAQIRSQLSMTATAIRQTTGRNPVPWFRFPYGNRDARTIAAVNAAGYVPIGWTVDTLGWEGTEGGISPSVVIDRVMSRLSPGEIVLMHVGANPDDGTTFDADALDSLITKIRSRGYSFVTVDAILG